MKTALCCLMHSFDQCPLYLLEKLRNDTLNNNDVELFLMFDNSSNLTIEQISDNSKFCQFCGTNFNTENSIEHTNNMPNKNNGYIVFFITSF